MNIGLSRRALFSLVAASPLLSVSLPALADFQPKTVYGSEANAATVKKRALAALKTAVNPENAGNLLRWAFHDSGTFDGVKKTGGANGSLVNELARPENGGLKYGFAVLKPVKAAIDEQGIAITWADLIQLAGAEAVAVCGGPKIDIKMGRKDNTDPNGDPAGQLPSATATAAELKELFGRNGYTTQDVVALSGAHTIGSARKNKPLGPMEKTYKQFDNEYFKMLLAGGGAFESDRNLVADPETKKLVELYAKDQGRFFKDYVAAHEKMANMGV